jgi:hypothetical protein
MADPFGQETTPEVILMVLRKHLQKQHPVTLYNAFEGVPVSYRAEIAMVHPHSIGLIVHPYQMACIEQQKITYIRSRMISGLVSANPVSMDFRNHIVLVDGLKAAENIIGDLYNLWVTPEQPVTVEVTKESEADRQAQLLEIAILDQNRVRMLLAVSEIGSYHQQDWVALTFRLQEGGDLLQVQGMVKNIIVDQPNANQERLEVEGSAAIGDEISILAYLSLREDQILEKLDQFYKKLRSEKKHHK